MKTALAGLGYKTHYVSNYQANRTHIKTLCGRWAYAVFDENKLATGSDSYCKRCEAAKARLEKVKS